CSHLAGTCKYCFRENLGALKVVGLHLPGGYSQDGKRSKSIAATRRTLTSPASCLCGLGRHTRDLDRGGFHSPLALSLVGPASRGASARAGSCPARRCASAAPRKNSLSPCDRDYFRLPHWQHGGGDALPSPAAPSGSGISG